MLQKKRNQKLEDGMVMDAQGVIYRQTDEGKSVVKVDLYSSMRQKSEWEVECYEIADGTTKIGQFAFDQCEGLKKVIIPSSVSVMSDYAFSFCTNLRKVTIPDNIGFEKPADYSPSSEREILPLASLGLQFKLLEHALGSLERVMIPADKRELLEEHWPHLKHLFVDK